MHCWTARKGDLGQKAWRSNWAVSTLSPLFSPEPWKNSFPSKLCEMEESLSQSPATHRVSQFAGLFLGLGLILRSYYMRELLACWLFFILVLVSLALIILVVVFACYLGKYIVQWVHNTARETPVVGLVCDTPCLVTPKAVKLVSESPAMHQVCNSALETQ
jgi:hypothetical protein